jgi:acyl-CoA reductase-like NAD-dependent aldehyde dehydrogenase
MATSPKNSRVAIEKTYKIYVGGKFPRTESGRYYALEDASKRVIANVCRGSRKDFRNAVVAARSAFSGWSKASAYLRGQILYRIAEMLEGRRELFVTELCQQGCTTTRARTEVNDAIDRLVYFAGWSDKYQQVFSSVNPVSSAHFNFSVLEPTGVVAALAPEKSALLGLISLMAPAIIGGNTIVILASRSMPLSAVSFAEVLNSSDVPAGVVNIITGFREELAEQFASHMDVNAFIHCAEAELDVEVLRSAANNIKHVVARDAKDWLKPTAENPYLISDTQEVKTTWHPIGT